MDTTFNLDSLSEKEQREIFSALSYKFRPGSKQAVYSEHEQLVWDAINRQIGVNRPLDDILTRAGKEYTRASYADDVEAVMVWIDSGCGRPISKTQRMAIVQTAVECLADHVMRRTRAPVVHKTLLQQLLKLPGALDRAFPCYHQAKILDRIAPMAA